MVWLSNTHQILHLIIFVFLWLRKLRRGEPAMMMGIEKMKNQGFIIHFAENLVFEEYRLRIILDRHFRLRSHGM